MSAVTITCPNCHAPAPATARYCGQCGASLAPSDRHGTAQPVPDGAVTAEMPMPPPMPPGKATQLQTVRARLLHVQTNQLLELPQALEVVHMGKPNNRVPPDLDVSGFPDAEIVSRVHASLRSQGDSYYLEDEGSSNGTYVNGRPIPPGHRCRLCPGDRIALGKGDKVTFVFQQG